MTVTVAVAPADAFEVFTAEIGQWYRRGLALLTRRGADVTLQIEPGVGGRVLEVAANPAEPAPGRTEVVRGRVTAWEPGRRLVFVDQKDTEVEVRFEAVAAGTRVTVEHRGLERLLPDQAASAAKYGWRRLAEWFEIHMEQEAIA